MYTFDVVWLDLMFTSEVAWVLVSLGTQVKPQIILDPNYLPHCLFRLSFLTTLKIRILINFNWHIQSLSWKNSMVALRIAIFCFVLRDTSPNSKIFVRMESVLPYSLLFRLRNVLKIMLLSWVRVLLFNFVTAVTWRINRIWKTVLTFMLT